MRLRTTQKKRPKLKLTSLVRIYVLVTVIVSLATLLFTISNLPPSALSEDAEALPKSKQVLGLGLQPLTKKKATKKDQCSSIADDEDDDLKPILEILCEAGYDVSRNSTEVDRSVLPKWSEILEGYGPPKILGLDSCQRYRDTIGSKKPRIGAAGLFNSGTNLLSKLIENNCPGHAHHDWQVPWGKHYPFRNRTGHFAKMFRPGKDSPELFLPIVSIRDPYTWLQSMCRQPYAAQYSFAKSSCPNLIPYPSDIEAHPRYKKMKYMPVHVNYDGNKPKQKYESMGHLWNGWYQEYIEFESIDGNATKETEDIAMKPQNVPFLVVRMEDLIFHAKTVVPQLCSCAGTEMTGNKILHTRMIQNTNRGIDVSSIGGGLLRSVVNYGNITKRRDKFAANQLVAAKEILDPRLLKLMGYPYEEP